MGALLGAIGGHYKDKLRKKYGGGGKRSGGGSSSGGSSSRSDGVGDVAQRIIDERSKSKRSGKNRS